MDGKISEQQQRRYKFIAYVSGAVLIALLELIPEGHDHGNGHDH